MVIKDDAIQEFIEIHLEKTGVTLEREQALLMGTNLIEAVKLVYKIDFIEHICQSDIKDRA